MLVTAALVTPSLSLRCAAPRSRARAVRLCAQGEPLADLQPQIATQCMLEADLNPVRVVEHALPPALQTHELSFMPPLTPGAAGSVLLSQMEEGRLLKLKLDPLSGELNSTVESATFAPEGTITSGRRGLPFVGLHGLAESSLPGKCWVTLQYINEILLVDVETLRVERAIACPRALDDGRGPIGGPHTVREADGKLFVCLKGGASCHDADLSDDVLTLENAGEATAHALWRVELDAELRPLDEGTVFEAPATPVMCVVTDDGTCWVACDASPTLFAVPADARTVLDCVYHQLPYHYALLKQTGPGVVLGPDGRPWFCVLNGNGLIGRVKPCGQLQMFELLKTFNPHQRLCHLSFDAAGVLYAISSDLLDKEALNTLIRVQFDATHDHVIAQHEIAFPTQQTCVHRLLHLDGGDNPSVLVSELSKSKVLQIFKRGLPPLDRFPTKTFEVKTRRVFDANEPCPRSGNALCHCASESGATIPTENIWADERAEEVYDPTLTPSIAEMTPVTDPRTGETELYHDFSRGTRADSAFSKFWSYGIKGFRREDVPSVTMYSANGAPDSPAGAQPGMLGATTDVLRYKPGYLKKLLAREPWRRDQLLEELRAAELINDKCQDWTPEMSDGCEVGSPELDARLDEVIGSAGVVMFSFTTCRFCVKAKAALDAKGAAYRVFELDAERYGGELRSLLAARTGRTSTPSVWIGGKFVGGLDDGPGLLPLDEEGALDPMLRAAEAME